MRLRQIEVFHAVYTSGSMTGAAAVLHVSQPSVSKVLAHAEQQLGYPLFERLKGKLTPTPEAHRLFDHVAAVYRDLDQLRRVSRNLSVADEGRIRIAATPAFGVDVLPRAIASYRRRHDKTQFEIETLHAAPMARALRESRVDIGLAFGIDPLPDIASESLVRAGFVGLAPADSALVAARDVRIEDLADQPFVALNGRGPLGSLLQKYLDACGVALNVVASCETYQVAKALVANGAGITIVDDITARSSGHETAQRFSLRASPEFDISVLHFDKVPMSVASQRFVDHLRESVNEFLSRSL
ncbi:MAG: LysR family transcriptional regulator [Gammaproteobacteria bacterium]